MGIVVSNLDESTNHGHKFYERMKQITRWLGEWTGDLFAFKYWVGRTAIKPGCVSFYHKFFDALHPAEVAIAYEPNSCCLRVTLKVAPTAVEVEKLRLTLGIPALVGAQPLLVREIDIYRDPVLYPRFGEASAPITKTLDFSVAPEALAEGVHVNLAFSRNDVQAPVWLTILDCGYIYSPRIES